MGFLALRFCGYGAGILAKILRALPPGETLQPVTLLYALNLTFVIIDILLFLRYRSGPEPQAT